VRHQAFLTRDLNGDGDLDLALLDARGRVSIYLGDGQGGYSGDSLLDTESNGTVWLSADLDGDGDLELITVAPDGRAVVALWNAGEASYRHQTRYVIDDSITSVVAADLDGDGDMDLAAGGPRATWLLVNDAASAIRDLPADVRPLTYALEANYPNPFNPATTIEFALPEPVHVRLDIFNVLGRRVTTLVNGPLQAGLHEQTWDGRTSDGHAAPSGVYFYRLQAGEFGATRRMLMLK
jgi:hypothetical protein